MKTFYIADSQTPNVKIVLSRCSNTKELFAIRFEEKGREQWVADWAFSVPISSANKEGYTRTNIHGSFGFDRSYPGCPHCSARSIFQCSCGKIACWYEAPLPSLATCPWCGSTILLSLPLTSMDSGVDI